MNWIFCTVKQRFKKESKIVFADITTWKFDPGSEISKVRISSLVYIKNKYPPSPPPWTWILCTPGSRWGESPLPSIHHGLQPRPEILWKPLSVYLKVWPRSGSRWGGSRTPTGYPPTPHPESQILMESEKKSSTSGSTNKRGGRGVKAGPHWKITFLRP